MTNSSPQTIGIIGAGTMGSGIALVALYAGHRVILHDVVPVMLEQANTYLEKFLTRKNMAERMANVTFADDLDALSPTNVVIEAALEDLALKQDLFARLERLCAPNAILTTNTSTLPVTAIASAVSISFAPWWLWMCSWLRSTIGITAVMPQFSLNP